jgi:hypothetical protein
VDLPYNAVPVLFDGEFEDYLGLAATIADDVFVAGLLVGTYHAAEESVEDSVEEGGLAALIEAGDEDYSFREEEWLFEFELLEIASVDAVELQVTPSSWSFARVLFQAS